MAKLKRRARRSGRLELLLSQVQQAETALARRHADIMPVAVADLLAEALSGMFLRALAALQARILESHETNAATVYEELRVALSQMYEGLRREAESEGDDLKAAAEFRAVAKQTFGALLEPVATVDEGSPGDDDED